VNKGKLIKTVEDLKMFPWPNNSDEIVFLDESDLVRLAQAIHNEALEEAAQKAFSWNTAMTDVLANEIRNLKEQQ
jgi:hypothetical protein